MSLVEGAINRNMRAVRDFFELIKFEHTIFALPFAYFGMLLAVRGWPGWGKFIWITIAMAAARTLAMALNRLIDLSQDARNPRTANRPLVTGRISLKTAWTGTLVSFGVLVLAAWQLGPLPLKLLPFAALLLAGYSFTKRFTWLSHFVLGFTDGLAPVGAWVAVTGSLFSPTDTPAWILLATVTFWIGGFDLIYACQDYDFDRQFHLHSIPARFGMKFALDLSVFCHLMTLGLLAWLGINLALTWPYWIALLITAFLLSMEHVLVKPDDLSHLNLAFFNINSVISICLFLGILGTLFLGV
jgi:4-hydroxybenzoate polyprenyltransferase